MAKVVTVTCDFCGKEMDENKNKGSKMIQAVVMPVGAFCHTTIAVTITFNTEDLHPECAKLVARKVAMSKD